MSPRSPALNEQLRAEGQAKILESALRLFATQGFERSSVTAIARDAGVSPGLIYHYFDSKEALLRALFERSLADVRASFEAADDADAPDERLERLIRASFALVREHLPFWKLSYGLRMQAAVLEALAADLPDWTGTIRSRLEAYLRDAGAAEAELEAALLFALIDGVAQHYALDPETYPLDAVSERIVARYRSAIATSE